MDINLDDKGSDFEGADEELKGKLSVHCIF